MSENILESVIEILRLVTSHLVKKIKLNETFILYIRYTRILILKCLIY